MCVRSNLVAVRVVVMAAGLALGTGVGVVVGATHDPANGASIGSVGTDKVAGICLGIAGDGPDDDSVRADVVSDSAPNSSPTASWDVTSFVVWAAIWRSPFVILSTSNDGPFG